VTAVSESEARIEVLFGILMKKPKIFSVFIWRDEEVVDNELSS